FSGIVSPGASPGIMTIIGDYFQGAQGTLHAEIRGVTPGSQYDQLIVTGKVTLSGMLETVFINGFVPSPGTTFTLIQRSPIIGSFGTAPSPSSVPTGPLSPVLDTQYGSSSVSIVTTGIVSVISDKIINTQVDLTNGALPGSTNPSGGS